MKFLTVLVIFTFCVIFIENTSGQGSPAANAGAYLTLYKERKKKKEEADRRKPPQGGYYRPFFYFK